MKCPKCKKALKLVSKGVSFNTRVKPKKKYSKKAYWCKSDDVWVALEIPAKK